MALVQAPAEAAVPGRVTAVMSLVEGHAEYVMDGVGPDVVPSVKTLRKRFAQRRKGRGPLDRVLRRDRKSTRLNSSHANISYAVFCLKKKNQQHSSPHTRYF